MPKTVTNEEERRTPYSISLSRRTVENARALTGLTNLSESVSRIIDGAAAREGALVETSIGEGALMVTIRVTEARKVFEWSQEHKGAYPSLFEVLPEGVETGNVRRPRVLLEDMHVRLIPALREAGWRVQEVAVVDLDHYEVWVAPACGPASVDVLGAIAGADARTLQRFLSAICKRLDEVTRV